MSRSARYFVLLLSLVAPVPAIVAQDPPSLDDQLLEDLPAPDDRELRGGEGREQPADSRAQPAGEDIGASGEDRIQKIIEQMEESRRRLAEGDVSERTVELQLKIAEQLAALIGQMRERQNSSSGQMQSANQDASSTASPTPTNTRSESAEGSAGGEPPPSEIPVGREVWGHLPAKIREQINSEAIEEFLPDYEELIEAYYRRLAEDQQQMPRQN